MSDPNSSSLRAGHNILLPGPGTVAKDQLPAQRNDQEDPACGRDRDQEPAGLDIVEVWGHGSFPASDPPANW